jgi:hypothetical protein
MGDVVNLRQIRKARRRTEHDREAEANRLAFGRTKAEREQTAADRSLAERRLDGHRRDETP